MTLTLTYITAMGIWADNLRLSKRKTTACFIRLQPGVNMYIYIFVINIFINTGLNVCAFKYYLQALVNFCTYVCMYLWMLGRAKLHLFDISRRLKHNNLITYTYIHLICKRTIKSGRQRNFTALLFCQYLTGSGKDMLTAYCIHMYVCWYVYILNVRVVHQKCYTYIGTTALPHTQYITQMCLVGNLFTYIQMCMCVYCVFC